MIIEKVEAISLEIPLTKRFAGSRYDITKRCTILTRITTSGGLVSQVYNNDNRSSNAEVVKIIETELAPIVIGKGIFSYERLWHEMFKLAEWDRNRALVMQAIACVDTAIWDLMGKAAGVNVSSLLGGYRKEVPIVGVGAYYEEGKTLHDLAREMAWIREQGLAGCKVKVGGLSPEEDAQRVAVCREGGGPDFLIAVDANRGWSVRDAISFARRIEQYDIAWFEEPCHWYDDARGMAEVRAQTSIPINAGQSEITSFGIRRLVDAGAVDVVNFDASEAGGVTEWRRGAAICATSHVVMTHHEEPQISLQLLSAVPNVICAELFADPLRDPLWKDIIVNREPPKNGVIAVPQGPGFGLELNEDLIRRYRLN